MINRAPVVLKKPVAIVQILQAASFVSRIFNSVISLPFCSCIFSTIILCGWLTLANLCLYYLIILSKVCVFMICFFLQNLCVYHLTDIPKFVCLSSYKFLQVCVLNIWQCFTKFLCFLSESVLQSLCVHYLISAQLDEKLREGGLRPPPAKTWRKLRVWGNWAEITALIKTLHNLDSPGVLAGPRPHTNDFQKVWKEHSLRY